jgi:hypothetical protein
MILSDIVAFTLGFSAFISIFCLSLIGMMVWVGRCGGYVPPDDETRFGKG